MPILANVIQSAFSPLISLFESIMVFIHAHVVGGSWGLAIIGLTVVVRAVMVPLTLSQFRSMQKLQQLAPEMKALQERYKDDKQRQQQELMKFYQENKVNPFASCLPLVLQLPVFISLFYMLRTDLKKRICGHALKAAGITTTKAIEKTSCSQVDKHSHAAKFLFIPDITHQASGVVLVVLLVLYVASQLGSTLMMTATADANQRRMMLALPLVFTLFIFRFPAGLLVYWITTNIWTLAQQYLVRRTMGGPPARPGTGDGESPSSPNGLRGIKLGPKPTPEPVLAGAGSGVAPPPPPRKKKKRSGRRR